MALRIQDGMANCYKITSHPIILTGIYTANFTRTGTRCTHIFEHVNATASSDISNRARARTHTHTHTHEWQSWQPQTMNQYSGWRTLKIHVRRAHP